MSSSRSSKSTSSSAARRRRDSPSGSPSACDTIAREAHAGAPTWILITAFVVLVLLAVALAYQYMIRPVIVDSFGGNLKQKQQQVGGGGGGAREMFYSASGSGVQLVYLYMDGCMWCDKFNPEWERFTKSKGDALTAAGVTYAKINGKSNDPRVAGLDIQGFPTIVIILAGDKPANAIFFEGGSRSAENMTKFVAENVPKFRQTMTAA